MSDPSPFLYAVTALTFGLWVMGCGLLLLLSRSPRFKSRIQPLWPLMFSELLILSVGILPWYLPDNLLGLVLVLAGARIGFESGSVAGGSRRYGLITAAAFAGLGALTWWLLGKDADLSVQAWMDVPVVSLFAAVLALIFWRRAIPPLIALSLYPGLAYAGFLVTASSAPDILAFAFLVVEVFDSFSLLGGKLFGKTPFAPVLSPRKTWQGLGTGAVVTLCCSLIISGVVGGPVLPMAALIAAAIIYAVIGDLVASAIKRRAGVKDYPPIIKIQGGLLDIMDSWLLAGNAISFIALAWVVHNGRLIGLF